MQSWFLITYLPDAGMGLPRGSSDKGSNKHNTHRRLHPATTFTCCCGLVWRKDPLTYLTTGHAACPPPARPLSMGGAISIWLF